MNSPSTRGNVRLTLLAVVLVALGAGAVWLGFLRGGENGEADTPLTDPLVRGPLRITVSESGSLEALDFHNVVNQVEGRTTIDYIVDEGTIITPEDVAARKVLVRLNSAEIEERRTKQEIEVAAAIDAHANAVTNLEIQLQQNASDLRKAGLDVRFARLDLERYVGKAFSQRLLDAYGSPPPANVAGAAAPPTSVNGGGNGSTPPAAGLDAAKLRRLIGSLLESEDLEGEALQSIRELDSNIHLSAEEHRRAEEKVRHSERLEGKGYVSKEELEANRLALKRREIERQRALTAREQFVSYDFPKEIVKLLSDVVEAKDRLSRAEKRAQAQEAQKRSAVNARKQQEELKQKRLVSYLEQEKACVIHATVPGLVVYASSGRERRWGGDDRIREGASVRQGQKLITIPLARSLGARINVHETVIDRVKPGQDAWVVVDAITGTRLAARVATVARLPNPADRWLNPDLKVYATMVELVGDNPTLKPGMSAQVEILIRELEDVFAVPVQCVAGTVEEPAVWIWEDGEAVKRKVALGMASDYFVEIREGLEPGMRVLLDPPREKRTGNGGANGGAQGPPAKGREGRPGGPPAGASQGGSPRGGAERSGSSRGGAPKKGARPEGGAPGKRPGRGSGDGKPRRTKPGRP